MSTATFPSPPVTSPAQRARALTRAGNVKADRTQAQGRIRAAGRQGAVELATLVESSWPPIARAFVWQVVRWVPYVGDVQARLLLSNAAIDPWARTGRLTVRQRAALAEGLRAFAAGPRKRSVAPAAPASGLAASSSRWHCEACGEPLRRQAKLCGFCIGEARETGKVVAR